MYFFAFFNLQISNINSSLDEVNFKLDESEKFNSIFNFSHKKEINPKNILILSNFVRLI